MQITDDCLLQTDFIIPCFCPSHIYSLKQLFHYCKTSKARKPQTLPSPPANKNSLKHSSFWKPALKWLNLHITLTGLYLAQYIVRKQKTQVGLTLSVIRQTVLHFNKVPLPISALLCKNLMQRFCYLYECNETQWDQTRSKALSSSRHRALVHAAPWRSSFLPTPCTQAGPRALPQPTAGQSSLEQASTAVQPCTPISKWEIKPLQQQE